MMLMWIIATLLAYFVKGVCGFANTLVFTTALSFVTSNVSISPIALLLGYPSNIILMMKDRKAIDPKICLPLCLLVVAGSVPGTILLKNTDAGLIKVLFGFVIVFIALQSLLTKKQDGGRRQSPVALAAIGWLAGLLCGLFGVGALVSVYMSRMTDDQAAFRSNLNVVFLVSDTFRVILYILWGMLTLDVMLRTLALIPLMLLGLWLGMRANRVLDEKAAKRFVLLALIVSGAALIASNLP